MIQLIKKQTYEQSHGLASHGTYQPYYFIKDGQEHFIRNLVTMVNDKYYVDKYQRDELASVLSNLRGNGYKFIRFYASKFTHPIEFLKWVIAEKLTLQIHGELFNDCETFTDFHGNLEEISCAFMFRIYDTPLLNELKEISKKAKYSYHYKREKNITV